MKELETERLRIRSWSLEDSGDLYEYAKSELVGPNAGWKPHESEEESKDIIRSFIEAGDTYGLELKSEKKIVGSIGLHKRRSGESQLKEREIGYVLNPDYWGRGLVPEAVRELLRYSFEELGLDLVWCGHFDFNQRSQRVVEKCGFTYRFTTVKKLEFLEEREVELLHYSMDREGYRSLLANEKLGV